MKKLRETIGKMFTAASFAEADCPEMAREFLGSADPRPAKETLKNFLHDVGLDQIKVNYGLVTVE